MALIKPWLLPLYIVLSSGKGQLLVFQMPTLDHIKSDEKLVCSVLAFSSSFTKIETVEGVEEMHATILPKHFYKRNYIV